MRDPLSGSLTATIPEGVRFAAAAVVSQCSWLVEAGERIPTAQIPEGVRFAAAGERRFLVVGFAERVPTAQIPEGVSFAAAGRTSSLAAVSR